MSSTGTPDPPAERDGLEPGELDPLGDEAGAVEDQAYFRALEEAFLALRGRTTLLGPEDWRTARAWRRQGIPAELVVAVMESLFARHRERRSKRGISSLRYFRAAVDAEWDERLARLAGGAPLAADPGPPISRRLAGLAAAIPDAAPGAADLRAALGGLAGDPLEVERELERIEHGWLEIAAAALSAAAREEIEARIERALARVAAEGEERERLAVQLRAQALRERHELPVLSLFASAALGDEPTDEG